MVRPPAVAGQFYPGQAEALRRQVQQFLITLGTEQTAIGIVVPHAGYIYSGAIAGMTFAGIKIPERVIILGPNHHGIGHPAAVFPDGSWETPLGESVVDAELAARIVAKCPKMGRDAVAHRYEHSLEVQLPFIQARVPRATIVPICLAFGTAEELVVLGEGLAQAVAESGEVLIVASSDLTHYESGPAAKEKDLRALARILALDAEGLFRTVREGRISMCGLGPVAVMLAAARNLGAATASLVRYGNSGDVSGDQSQVVGYAGVIVQ